MNHIKRVPFKTHEPKGDLHQWVLLFFIGISVAISLYFGVAYYLRMDQRLLHWKSDCVKSGGTWYSRIISGFGPWDGYREYVCRMEVER